MAENTYNWQSMDYKELCFVDKHLDMSLPEQVELRQQLRDYTAGRVKAFADGSALIQNAAEYSVFGAGVGIAYPLRSDVRQP